jgi:exopolysaccharide biosynthesis polyprenyl glycosylphosphotransferase
MDRSGGQPALDGEEMGWEATTARGNRPTPGSVVPIRAHGASDGMRARPRSSGIRELALSGQEQPAFATSPVAGGGATAPLVLRPGTRRRSILQYVFEREGWTSVRLLGDLLTSFAAVLLVLSSEGSLWTLVARYPSFLVFPLLVAAMLHARGMYRRRVRLAVLDDVAPVIGAISVAAMAVLTWQVGVQGDSAAGPAIGRIWLLTVLLLGGVRALLAFTHRHVRSNGLVGKRTLIVGAGVVGAAVARRLEHQPEYGLRPVGFVDADPPNAGVVEDRPQPVLGSPDELAEIAAAADAEHVIFAFASERDHALIPLARHCEELGLEVSLVPRFFDSMNDRVMVERIGSLPLLGLRSVDPKGWQFNLKYALDRPIALLGLLVLAPLIVAIGLAVKLTSRGPLLFRQRRVGRDGQVFDMLKFRSMHLAPADASWHPQPGSAPGGVEGPDRRTRMGRFLRRSALDEIPQLVNVLKGEMSLIGPRPERPEFASLFGSDLARYTDRHRVKSGITGWAQVSGLRGQTSLADRVAWDNYYIENWSPALDLKILAMTVGAVLRSGE